MAPTAPRSLSAAQLFLFVEGALVTLLISLGGNGDRRAARAGAGAGAARELPPPPAGDGLRGARPRHAGACCSSISSITAWPACLPLGPFTAAIVGLGLNYAAYEAEIYRAAIASVPRAQWEAALAVGATRRIAFREVILPQALRLAVPGMTNDFISLLKDSSLVSVLTVVELTKRMTITAVDNRGWIAARHALRSALLRARLPVHPPRPPAGAAPRHARSNLNEAI